LDEHSQTSVDFARAALTAAAHDSDSVPVDVGAGAIKSPIAGMDLPSAFTRTGDVEVMLALDSLSDQPLSFSHPDSSIGAVEIDSDTCTLCAQCAQTCPTDAITAHYEGGTVALSFDAALCTNCAQCTIACPEIEQGAIRVTGRVDVEKLAAGRQTLNEGVVLVCESCGNPIAPSPMMDRIGQLLGDGFDDTMSYLTRRCMDCRGLT
jgi:ferredoxin